MTIDWLQKLQATQIKIFGNLESALSVHLLLSHELERNDGGFRYVPKDNKQFYNWLRIAEAVLWDLPNGGPVNFLDVGSGIGTKPLMARLLMGWNGCGLEFRKEYHDFASRLIGQSAFLGDGRTFDKYGDFDVIYYYRPMHDCNMQADLQEAIYQGAREGAIIICDGNRITSQKSRCIFGSSEGPVQIQIKTNDEALFQSSRARGLEFLVKYPECKFW